MSKLREVVNGATFEAEGDEAAVVELQRLFHLMLAEQRLAEIETALRPLQESKRRVKRHIAELRAQATGETREP